MESKPSRSATWRIAAVIGVAVILAACGGKPAKLSPADLTVVNALGFDKGAMQALRKLTDSALTIVSGNPDAAICFKDSLAFEAFKKKNIRGVQFREDKEKARIIVQTLRGEFRQKGLYIYVSDQNFGYEPEKITIIKTDDKFDLLRFEATNGINYDLFCEDIIAKLSTWDKTMGLEFTSVGADFAEAGLTQVPAALPAFADELYKFCPDIVDQGTGSVEVLQEEIKRTRSLYLWWD